MAATTTQPTTKAATTTPAQTQADKALRESLQVKAPDEVVDWLNLLVYGEPGVGKTYLSGTAEDDPRTAPVLFLDVEGGVTTLRSRKSMDVVPIRSIPQLNEIYEKLVQSVKDNKLYYKTVVIDSLTELADLDMRYIMTDAYNRNPDKIDKDVPDQRGWGKNRAHIRTLVRAFRDLPCHTIFTAGLAVQVEEGQPSKSFPGFAGKLRTEVPGFCDIVGYYYNDTSTGEVERIIQFQGTRRVQAKDRTGALGGNINNPTIPMMWDLIHPSK